jgi:DNA-binding NarL/FixJ family response regulator
VPAVRALGGAGLPDSFAVGWVCILPFGLDLAFREELELLTQRELEVLKLIAEGHTSKEIATTLVLSLKTIESHRANILGKLGMRDRVDLTRYAIRRGLIEP